MGITIVVRYHKGKNFETKLQLGNSYGADKIVVRYHKGKNFETKLQHAQLIENWIVSCKIPQR